MFRPGSRADRAQTHALMAVAYLRTSLKSIEMGVDSAFGCAVEYGRLPGNEHCGCPHYEDAHLRACCSNISCRRAGGERSGWHREYGERVSDGHRAGGLGGARKPRSRRSKTPAEVAARQQYIRAKVLESIGEFPARTPLKPRIVGTLDREGYRIEKLIYESQPRFYVTANLYLPTQGKAPYPAVLGPAGHYDLAKAEPVYQRAWISLAKRGFVVLAYDPSGQGERMESFDPDLGRQRFISTQEHMMGGPAMPADRNQFCKV